MLNPDVYVSHTRVVDRSPVLFTDALINDSNLAHPEWGTVDIQLAVTATTEWKGETVPVTH